MLKKKSPNEIDGIGWGQGEQKNSLAQLRLSPHSSYWKQLRKMDESTGTESGGLVKEQETMTASTAERRNGCWKGKELWAWAKMNISCRRRKERISCFWALIYGERGRYKFNEGRRCTEIDELSTIHKPKAKAMFCSNNMHFTSSLVSTQLVRGNPSTAHQSYFFHLFQLWTGCAESSGFFVPQPVPFKFFWKTQWNT